MQNSSHRHVYWVFSYWQQLWVVVVFDWDVIIFRDVCNYVKKAKQNKIKILPQFRKIRGKALEKKAYEIFFIFLLIFFNKVYLILFSALPLGEIDETISKISEICITHCCLPGSLKSINVMKYFCVGYIQRSQERNIVGSLVGFVLLRHEIFFTQFCYKKKAYEIFFIFDFFLDFF